MSRKEDAVDLINKKLKGETLLMYTEIAEITGYHPKYILKLKNEILNNKISFVHGNKDRKPINTISEEERKYIIDLYKRSNASVRKFCKFYGKRSYSCIYNVLRKEGLLENSEFSRKNLAKRMNEKKKEKYKKSTMKKESER